MIERPNPDEESALPDDPPPASDPDPTPRFPKQAPPAEKTKVVPLDEDENLEDGIEVNET
jgi:hypothetical protein